MDCGVKPGNDAVIESTFEPDLPAS